MSKTYAQKIEEYREFHETDAVCRHGEWAYACETCSPRKAIITCNDCGKELKYGNLCRACGYNELEYWSHKMFDYIIDVESRAKKIEDHSARTGLYEGGMQITLSLIKEMRSLMKGVGQDADS